MLHELGEPQSSHIVLFQENLGTICWTDSLQCIRKVKHIGVKYNYFGSKVGENTFKVHFSPSAKNQADAFTKILGADLFKTHRDYIRVVDKPLLGR